MSNVKDDIKELIKLSTNDKSSSAEISLNLGGGLRKLILNNELIVNDLPDVQYTNSFASAILFPFVNRIKNGEYTYKDKSYYLDRNDGKNALHGLVYDKEFRHIESEKTKNYDSVTIKYDQSEHDIGFPFKYSIYLTYKLTAKSLFLEVLIKNKDCISFPFNIGWHPYFYTNDLYNSHIQFKSDEKFLLDKNKIPIKRKRINPIKKIRLEDKDFDDCFVLHDSKIVFETPTYKAEIRSSSKENYLQLYTPRSRKFIAIELLTSPANSFNNKIGLQILNPSEIYTISWKIELENE